MTLASESVRARRPASPRKLSSALAGFTALAALVLGASPAHAEDAETRTAARDLATQGGQAYDAGRYEEARDFFLRAYELVRAPSIALMQARSLVKLGRLLEAIDVYEQTARFKLATGAPEIYLHAVDSARAEVEDVRRHVPRLKITLVNARPNEAAEVMIDDKPTPAALLGVDRPMNPGLHRVVLWVSGQSRAARELSVDEGKSYSVELDAAAPLAPGSAFASEPENKPGSARPPAPEAPPNTGPASSGASLPATRVLGFVGVGVGVVGLGIGTYTGLVALHHKSRLDDACHPACPESSAGDLNGFRVNRTVSWLSYGVGLAAAASGVLLLTLGDGKHEHVALRVLPGGLQIAGRL